MSLDVQIQIKEEVDESRLNGENAAFILENVTLEEDQAAKDTSVIAAEDASKYLVAGGSGHSEKPIADGSLLILDLSSHIAMEEAAGGSTEELSGRTLEPGIPDPEERKPPGLLCGSLGRQEVECGSDSSQPSDEDMYDQRTAEGNSHQLNQRGKTCEIFLQVMVW